MISATTELTLLHDVGAWGVGHNVPLIQRNATRSLTEGVAFREADAAVGRGFSSDRERFVFDKLVEADHMPRIND